MRPRSKQQAPIFRVSSWNTWGEWKEHCSFLSSKSARGNNLNGNNRREQMHLKVDVAHQHHQPTHLLLSLPSAQPLSTCSGYLAHTQQNDDCHERYGSCLEAPGAAQTARLPSPGSPGPGSTRDGGNITAVISSHVCTTHPKSTSENTFL